MAGLGSIPSGSTNYRGKTMETTYPTTVPCDSVVKLSASRQHDSYYKLPEYVERFMDQAGSVIAARQDLRIEPWTINRLVSLFRKGVLVAAFSYDFIELDYQASIKELEEAVEITSGEDVIMVLTDGFYLRVLENGDHDISERCNGAWNICGNSEPFSDDEIAGPSRIICKIDRIIDTAGRQLKVNDRQR